MSNDKIHVGIIGGGFVGKATSGFKSSKTSVSIFDLQAELCVPKGVTIEDMYKCDVVFVAVPTPMSSDGSCHTNIVKKVVHDLKSHQVKHIIIRSTVPVGTSEELGVHFMPEFLTEKHWKTDFFECGRWVIGVDDDENIQFKNIMTNIIHRCVEEGLLKSKNISFCSTKEAELIKYFRNCFLATKIGFCNEIYSLCRQLGLNYEHVRENACEDYRIGHSHSHVPGHDDKFGFGGTCFPKDLASLIHQFATHNVTSPILNAVQQRNVVMDRPGQDWKLDQGRAVI